MSETLFEQARANSPKSFLEREYEVVGGGLIDGLGRAGGQTLQDIKTFGSNFANDWSGTTGGFLKDHWSEAAVGAAITFANPKKWVTSLLFAYSMRGLLTDTAQAAWLAGSSDADTARLRAQYASSVSHEGTAFLSSLPMTMAGGYVGRAGAGIAFGKTPDGQPLGALDLLSGKVTPAMVQRNIMTNLLDKIRPPETKLLITDMDGTVGNFSGYFAHGIKNAIPELASNPKLIEANMALPEAQRIPVIDGKLSEEWLYKAIGGVMDQQRSHDYPWSVELAVGEKLGVGQPGRMSAAEFNSTAVQPFWATMDKALVEHLDLYPQVLETLSAVKDRGIPTVVLSDAPAYIGLRRLTHMGLDRGYVERLYALHNWEVPNLPDGGAAPQMARVQSMLDIVNGLTEFRAIPKSFEKPHTQGFQALMDQYGVRPAQTLMVGDSRVKDLGVAYNAGARGLWAKYGQPDAHSEAILERLRPLPEEAPTGPKPAKVYPPSAGPPLENYGQVLNYLKPKADWGEILRTGVRHGLAVRPSPAAALGFTIHDPLIPQGLGGFDKTEKTP